MTREWFNEQFDLAIEDLDPKSSTGLSSLARYGATIGEALIQDIVTGEYDPNRVRILKEMTFQRLAEPQSPDPILVFVKPEPHTKRKILEERYRIISAVGLVDTMADRIMFGWLQRKAVSTVGSTPVMVGWSPYGGGYRHLTLRFSGRKCLCADRSSWDWTVQGWLLKAIRDLILNLAVGAPESWKTWLHLRWEALFRDAVFGFRSGERVRQPGWGVMKSGCYLTILLNSFGQIVMHAMACRKLGFNPQWSLFFCMGDDTAQAEVPDVERYFEALALMGAVIKESRCEREIEFCGHRMEGLRVVPAYKAKHIFKLRRCTLEVLPLMLQAYQFAYADTEFWSWLTSQLGRVEVARWSC